MTAPAWLIAEREFRAYTATATFWIALAIGPLVMTGALAMMAVAGGPPQPIAIAIRAVDPALARSATAALVEAGRIEGRRYAPAASATASARLILTRLAVGGLEARFSDGFPLSSSGQALVARTIERDQAWRRLTMTSDDVRSDVVRQRTAAASPAAAAGTLSRFALVMILWLTLAGSLGMLLQAVVRERANRALEGLLAAARPWDILLGKLAGVGAVSGLLLAAWLGSTAVLGAMAPGGSLVQAVFSQIAAPAMLARSAAIYLLAFGFYGMVTVGVGAAARDSAAAQNLSRPMFAVLLAAFFVALASVSGSAGRLDWLVYAPPFTPFLLLLKAPGALPAAAQLAAVGLTLAATAVAARLAVGRLTLSGAAA